MITITVFEKVRERERLSVNKRAVQKINMERFCNKKLNDNNFKKRIRLKFLVLSEIKVVDTTIMRRETSRYFRKGMEQMQDKINELEEDS
jgi:predicted transposase YbfD/YdcC